jgi:phosphohistidine swiveling domain-containing protein
MGISYSRSFISIKNDYKSKELLVNTDEIGGKSSSLLILSERFNVPSGIILTTGTFDEYLEQNGLLKILEKNQKGKSKLKDLNKALSNSAIPEITLKSLERRLDELGMIGHPLIVRSSATAEDSETASFAGRFRTVINVNGIEQVAKAIKEVYDSAYSPEVISYCHEVGIPLKKIKMAVVIQKLIIGSYSGVMFTRDPVNLADKTIIEAISGLNEGMVSGKITPSRFVFDNKDHRIESSDYVLQNKIFVPDANCGTRISDLNSGSVRRLPKAILYKLAEMGLEIEKTFGLPQDIEWTVKDGKIYILQSRSITTGRKNTATNAVTSNSGTALIGYPASAGMASGKIKKISGPGENIPKGIVLALDVLDTDYSTESVKGVKAIVTQDGGVLSHAAIVARELGIPCVVGVEGIMEKVKDGNKVVVDGTNGVVYMNSISSGISTERRIDYSYLYDFDRMLKLGKKDIYYEEFDDRVIYYSYPELGKNDLKKLFGKAYREGKDIKRGGAPKNYICHRYYEYKQNMILNRLTESAIGAARSCKPELIEKVSKNLLKEATKCMSQYDKIPGEGRKAYLERLSKLLHAEWCYTLVNELICEGYGITSLQRKLNPILSPMGKDISYFLDAVDSNGNIYVKGLSAGQREALNDAVKYYRKLKEWRLGSYPKFRSVGATGSDFEDKFKKTISKLSKDGQSRDRIMEEATRYINR